MRHQRSRKHVRAVLALSAVLFAASSGSLSAEESEKFPSSLAPRVQQLLQQEMQSIHAASQQILTAMVEGDESRVADLAQQIHDSFILRQSMTKEEKAGFTQAAPQGFVKLDRAFHRTAADLAEAARAHDRERQHAAFARMIEACSSCHAEYAASRFPGFRD